MSGAFVGYESIRVCGWRLCVDISEDTVCDEVDKCCNNTDMRVEPQ